MLLELSRRVDVFLLAGEGDDVVDDLPRKVDVVDEPHEMSDDDDEKEEPEVFISGEELHDLKPLHTKGGALEFELRPAAGRSPARVDLLHGDTCVVQDVTDVRRSGKLFAARAVDTGWVSFNVPKFTKEWTQNFPLDVLVGVEA